MNIRKSSPYEIDYAGRSPIKYVSANGNDDNPVDHVRSESYVMGYGRKILDMGEVHHIESQKSNEGKILDTSGTTLSVQVTSISPSKNED